MEKPPKGGNFPEKSLLPVKALWNKDPENNMVPTKNRYGEYIAYG